MTTIIFILAGVGLLLLIAELFLPGGVLGVAGGAMMVAAVVISFAQHGFQKGAFMLLLLGFASIILFFVWLRIFPNTAAGRILMLRNSVGAPPSPTHGLEVGMAARAVTALRPAGTVRCGDRTVDAASDGEFIDAGSLVEVVRIEPDKVIVKVQIQAEATAHLS